MQNEPQFLDYEAVLKKVGIGYGDQVGDFGCGAAAFFPMAAARMVGENGRVYAVDIVRSVLHSLKTRASIEGITNVVPVWSNLEVYNATKIPSESLDLGMVVNVLFQSGKRAELLTEIARMIKSKGRLLVIDWKKEKTPLGPPADKRINPDDIRVLCRSLGMRETALGEVGQFHWGLLFVKE